MLSISLLCSSAVYAGKKQDKKTIKQLQTDITYLASDELEGRRTGTEGERKAADYIEKRYKEIGVAPYGGHYRYPFKFTYGREIGQATKIRINNTVLAQEEAFPMAFSGSKRALSDLIPDVMEQGGIWLLPLYADKDQSENPHFEVEKSMFDRAKEAEKKGASGVMFYGNFEGKYPPVFARHSEYEAIGIPVVFISDKAYGKYLQQNGQQAGAQVELDIAINKTERTGNNLAAYIDNHAKYTVIIGAHYDHLGYGEDGNSLHANAGKDHQIHHGADDNASGTAAVLEMATRLKKEKLHHYNYLFLNFSGEELGLYGSKAFVKEQSGMDSNHIAYMVNMDMVGRLNDSTHALTLGGVGTSPTWASVVEMGGSDFRINIDSAGIGPSDHTSFYNAGIPVLFFFTGTHKDYHKPSDQAALINYAGENSVLNYVDRVVRRMDKEEIKPAYTVTRQSATARTSFKVSLGIMPDYTFDNGGVRVDGVSDNRPAIKAGIKTGDVIIKLGDYKVMGMQTYMEALGKFTPGDKTQVTILRDGKEIVLPIELNK